MFKPFTRNQDFLLPPSLRELIPQGDLVYLVTEVTELLNLQPLYNRYDSLGQNSYHPAMLISVLFYAYSQGVFSSRKIAERLQRDVHFMYLSGMQTPNFRTISDFRKNNIDLLKGYFVQIVRICQSAGMAALKSISIDGTKIQASASNKKTKNKDALTAQAEAIQAEIDRLLQLAEKTDESEEVASATDEKAVLARQIGDLDKLRLKLQKAKNKLDCNTRQSTINLTDPDCRSLKNLGPGYNAQLAVDCDDQLIVAANVVAETNDVRQLTPMIEEVEANTESKSVPKKVLADCGYASLKAFKELEEKPNLDAYVPTRDQVHHQTNAIPPFDKSRFNIDPKNLTCYCPLGHAMRIGKRDIHRSGEPFINFIGVQCPDCPSRSDCTKAKYRNIMMFINESVVQAMKQKMGSDAGRRAMQVRKQTVEPAFGTLKEHLGFRRFGLRGLQKVKGEFALLCSSFNLRKLHSFLQGSPLSGALAQIRALLPSISDLLLNFQSILCFKVFRWT